MGGSSGGGGGGDGGGGANPATAEVATDLVALARSDDPSCARSAVGALANLSENDATHERLLGWGASFLSKLALENAPAEGGGGGAANNENVNDGSMDETVEGGDGGSGEGQMAAGGAGRTDVGLVREVTRCLANLAGNYATHDKLLDGGTADALVGSLKREDAVTARFAALGLANLAGQVGEIVPGDDCKLCVPETLVGGNPSSHVSCHVLTWCIHLDYFADEQLQTGSPRNNNGQTDLRPSR